MQLHDLRPHHLKEKKKTRVGRGGKRGTYSGRGSNGQKQHAGRRIKPAISNLIIRLPKLRGFKNKPKSPKAIIINIKDLAKLKSDIVSPVTLLEAGFIVKRDLGSKIKLLSDGEAMKAYTVSPEIITSVLARNKIEKAGGKVSADVSSETNKVQ
ncbi:MAG: 50S ribosomal protein L15 [Candidatus Harrisonbacteria bacterium]|nr:50S ribosomal protein L15 [Candidatus Harrisonbacteria bacterium]